MSKLSFNDLIGQLVPLADLPGAGDAPVVFSVDPGVPGADVSMVARVENGTVTQVIHIKHN